MAEVTMTSKTTSASWRFTSLPSADSSCVPLRHFEIFYLFFSLEKLNSIYFQFYRELGLERLMKLWTI